MQTRKGQSIEDASMRVIEDEIGAHGYGRMEWPVVRRVIHSTADFDFAGSNAILFSDGAVASGIGAIRGGCRVIADVDGVVGLLNRQALRDFGIQVICRISDPEVARIAAQQDVTRSQASMRAARDDMDGGIVVIGNAPTALLEVIRMIREGIARPALVIGIPVGFISAAESKAELARTDTEYITNIGRKGGSPSAAAMLNALLRLARESPP